MDMLQWMDVSTLGGRKLMEHGQRRLSGGFRWKTSSVELIRRCLLWDIITIIQQHAEHPYILRLYHLHNIAYITGCVLFIFIVFVLMCGFLYVCIVFLYVSLYFTQHCIQKLMEKRCAWSPFAACRMQVSLYRTGQWVQFLPKNKKVF